MLGVLPKRPDPAGSALVKVQPRWKSALSVGSLTGSPPKLPLRRRLTFALPFVAVETIRPPPVFVEKLVAYVRLTDEGLFGSSAARACNSPRVAEATRPGTEAVNWACSVEELIVALWLCPAN